MTIINIYIANNSALKNVKQKLTEMKVEIGISIIIIGNFNTILSIMDQTIKQMTNKETEDLNNTLSQTRSNIIYRTLNNWIYIIFKCTWHSPGQTIQQVM